MTEMKQEKENDRKLYEWKRETQRETRDKVEKNQIGKRQRRIECECERNRLNGLKIKEPEQSNTNKEKQSDIRNEKDKTQMTGMGRKEQQ